MTDKLVYDTATKTGKAGSLTYWIVPNPDNGIEENEYNVIVSDGKHRWCAVHNTGHVACDAFVQGLRHGRCKNVVSADKQGCGYSEYGGDVKIGL